MDDLLRGRLAGLKLLSLDTDGVLTDGGLYYTDAGDEMRKFNVKDGMGMQMLIEGLAMGAFATIQKDTHDPVLRQLIRFTMADEAAHHKFGKIWADRTIPELSTEEHEHVETWAAECFEVLLFNLIKPITTYFFSF